MAADHLDDYIDAVSKALALPVEDAWRPAVRANLEVSLRLAGWSMNSRCPMIPSRPVSIQPDRTMTVNTDGMSAEAIAQAVAARKISALEVTEAALGADRQT